MIVISKAALAGRTGNTNKLQNWKERALTWHIHESNRGQWAYQRCQQKCHWRRQSFQATVAGSQGQEVGDGANGGAGPKGGCHGHAVVALNVSGQQEKLKKKCAINPTQGHRGTGAYSGSSWCQVHHR